MASLNNRSGRVGWLEAALRALQKGNVDVGFLQETKLKQGINTRHGVVYAIWETEAESRHQGGVTVVWRETMG